MKVVLFADLHLDAPFSWLGDKPHIARKRRQALRDTLSKILELAVSCRAEALLCAGDLYEHDKYTPDTAAFLQRSFADARPLQIFIAPGNHDWIGPGSIYHQAAWTDNVHVFSEDHLEPVPFTDGFTIWGAAHRAPANTRGFLDDFRVERGGVNIALFHGSEQGWLAAQESDKIPHAPFQTSQVMESGLAHALVGHYHCPRDEERFTYPGNPDPLTFGEEGQRGAVVATILADGSVKRERHNVATTVAHDVEIDLTDCTNQQDVREMVKAALQGMSDIARVTLSGEIGANVDLRLHDLFDVAPWLDAVAIRTGAIRAAYELDAISEESTVRGWFVRTVRAADVSEDDRRRVLITGLRALEGRDDLEVL